VNSQKRVAKATRKTAEDSRFTFAANGEEFAPPPVALVWDRTKGVLASPLVPEFDDLGSRDVIVQAFPIRPEDHDSVDQPDEPANEWDQSDQLENEVAFCVEFSERECPTTVGNNFRAERHFSNRLRSCCKKVPLNSQEQ
jgi:hypothetical protein